MKRWAIGSALILLSAASGLAQTALKEYPSLDTKQLGAVRHMVELANRPPGYWEFMEPENAWTLDSMQFQLAYMDYALSVVQSQIMPAYREAYHQASRNLIRKMLRPDVWDVWLIVINDPEFKSYLDTAKDWRDPVHEKNIMFSGHLLQMISLYETLYDDREFDAPGSLVFELPGPQGFRHTYDHASLAKLISEQFVRSDHMGIECEPNRVFTECNQHPILGLLQYDQLHGADLSEVRHGFWQKIEEINYIDPKTKRTMLFYPLDKKEPLRIPLAWSDGWTGMMMHAWQREFVEDVYPTQRDAELSSLIDTEPEHWRVRWGKMQVSIDFGFLAAYAAEMGDRMTVQTLLDYADKHFSPRWADGGYFYPAHVVVGEEYKGPSKVVPPEMLGQHQMGPLTGNALLNFARLNPGNGIWNLYNNISATSFSRSGDPEVVDIRYPEVQVTQAYYDKQKRRLAVAMVPGTDYQGQVSFGIRYLSGDGRYVVMVDGAEKALLDHGTISAPAPHSFQAVWDAKRQELRLSCKLGSGHTVVVEEM